MKFRSGLDRYNKYASKFVPETIAARFSQVRDIALERAQEAQIKYATIQEQIVPLLDTNGVNGPMRALYLGFANKLTRHLERVSGQSATKIADGLKSFYVTAFGADPTILDAIINAIFGGAYTGGGSGGESGGGSGT